MIEKIIKVSEAGKLNGDFKAIQGISNRYNKFLKQASNSEKPGHFKNLVEKELKPFILKIEEIKRGINNKTYIEEIRKYHNKLPKLEDHWYLITNTFWRKPTKTNCNITKTYLDKLNRTKKDARTWNWTWRTTQELIQAHLNKEFIIFNTLTVSNENYETIFEKRSKAFREYINNLNKCTEEPGRYFGIRETGELGRQHLHTLHTYCKIPKQWQLDPNYGRRKPYRREIQSIKKHWKWGYSTPIAIRFNSNDAWAHLGWRWPTDRMGTPKPTTSPIQLAKYLAKYLTKQSQEESELWLTKRTQNWGMTTINKILDKMTNQELMILMLSKTKHHWKIAGIPTPPTILRWQAMKNFNSRQKIHLNTLMALNAQDSIIKRIQILTNPTQTYNPMKTESLEIRNMRNTDISDLTNKWDTIAWDLIPYDATENIISLPGKITEN